jgi:hypothetical protein
MKQGAFLDLFSPDQQMIVSHTKLPQPIQNLVGNSTEIYKYNYALSVVISRELRTVNNIPWEAFLFVVDQDIILLLYYKYIRKTSTSHHKKTFNTYKKLGL